MLVILLYSNGQDSMNLIAKGRNKRRGIIGVEAAIVMIAFVIVAAALSFVVLNMGFSTTQKAKTTITDSLEEASSSMEVAGKITGVGHVTANSLNATTIPLKIASGGASVNLDPNSASIRYTSQDISYDNIYVNILSSTSYNSTDAALDAAETAGDISTNPMNNGGFPDTTSAIVWYARNNNNNAILDNGELAMLTIVWSQNERPQALDNISTEVVLPTGATLSAERDVPSITNQVVDMG